MLFLGFNVLFPDLADREAQAIDVEPDQPVPEGTYVLLDGYCADAGCDCRRVLLRAVNVDTAEPVAVISHAFDAAGPSADPTGQTYLHPLFAQSRYAPAMLALFERLNVSDPTYEDRLFEHYCLFKGVVDDWVHPLQAKLRAARSALPARASPRVGANDPCPCGSGKKFKRCCRP